MSAIVEHGRNLAGSTAQLVVLHNNDGNTPPAYSAYERFYMGWLTPRLLVDQEKVTLHNINEGEGESLLISENNQLPSSGWNPLPRIFYTLETRVKKGWDEFLPGEGMLITRISYNQTKWQGNSVNNDPNNMGVDILEATGGFAEGEPQRPLTIIYPGAKNVAENLLAEDGSLGIRITEEPFSKNLCAMLHHPIVSTSANISGQPAARSFREICDEIKQGVDYICRYRQKDPCKSKPSSIIKLGVNNEVSYHTPVAELNNVLSVLLSSDVINRIYLIDNSEGPLRLPVEDSRVEYRFSGKNLGFGRGHNIAIRESIRTGVPFHLIMNSDVMFHAEHIGEMLQYMEAHADVACMMPNVQFPTGKPQRLCKLLPTPMDLLGRRFLPEAGE